jgi:hypothetical protein
MCMYCILYIYQCKKDVYFVPGGRPFRDLVIIEEVDGAQGNFLWRTDAWPVQRECDPTEDSTA